MLEGNKMPLHLTPIAILLIEHRNIESVIEVMDREINNMMESNKVKPVFIDEAVDFIRMYADKSHHGKEEDIFFKALYRKKLSDDHKAYIDDLVQDHKMGRKQVGELVNAKEQYIKKHEDTFGQIIKSMKWLVDFYPRHIEKEDKHFFKLYLEYFTDEEKDQMLLEFIEFGKKGIHAKYTGIVKRLEKIIAESG